MVEVSTVKPGALDQILGCPGALIIFAQSPGAQEPWSTGALHPCRTLVSTCSGEARTIHLYSMSVFWLKQNTVTKSTVEHPAQQIIYNQ